MSEAGHALALAAERLVGVPFRLHGRDPATGLDCVGLVSAALAAIGRKHTPPQTYRLRNLHWDHHAPTFLAAGFRACSDKHEPGDLLLMQPSAGQYHLLLCAPRTGLFHAHAGLGRVVWTPQTPPWPQLGHWRLGQD